MDDKGRVSAIYHNEGPTEYLHPSPSQQTTLADLSVTGTYDTKTGQIQGTYDSPVTTLTTNNIHTMITRKAPSPAG